MAYDYYKACIPLPVDMHAKLLNIGIIPKDLKNAFEGGAKPEEIIQGIKERTGKVGKN